MENYDFNTYTTLAGGGVPGANTYSSVAASSPNGVTAGTGSGFSWGDTINGIGQLAKSGASIYSTIASSSKSPPPTNINFIDPTSRRINTAVDPTTGRVIGSTNNNYLVIGAVAVVGLLVMAFVFLGGKKRG